MPGPEGDVQLAIIHSDLNIFKTLLLGPHN